MEFNSSEHPISWFSERYREETLDIRPPYQRKPVWTMKQKSYLIESILMGLPVPEIFIQQVTSPQGKTTYAIVDGQQRIRTILQFIGSEKDPDEQESNKFVLDKLEDASKWKNLTFAELKTEERVKFYGYRFSVRYLTTDSEREVRDMFLRLNKFLTPLKPQELRNAIYTGPFVRMVLKLADNEYWAENHIVTPALIRRMTDVEFVSELLIGVLHGPRGGSSKVIDEYYHQYEDYEDEFPSQQTGQKSFEETLLTIEALLPEIKNTRWSNKTDFYTLFVGIASLLRSNTLPRSTIPSLRKALSRFANEIDLRLSDKDAIVRKPSIEYVRAVEKGANDKKKRGDRQIALVNTIGSYFKLRKSI